MTLAQLQRQRLPIGQPGTDGGPSLPQPRMLGDFGSGTNFQDTLETAIHRVDAMQKDAENQVTAFVAGEQENLHEVMISMNQAKLSFDLMVEVRNRALETYQELMRMQV